LNAKISQTGVWAFEFFDSTSSTFIPVGTLSDATASAWTPTYIDNFDFGVSDYANSRREIAMRISVTSSVQTRLYLDLFAIRSWTPGSGSNQALKGVV